MEPPPPVWVETPLPAGLLEHGQHRAADAEERLDERLEGLPPPVASRSALPTEGPLVPSKLAAEGRFKAEDAERRLQARIRPMAAKVRLQCPCPCGCLCVSVCVWLPPACC